MAAPAVPNGTGRSDANGTPRISSGARPPAGRRKDLSQIEKSVTHLLIATKQLLETLTQWSRHNATESEVSDVYVRLGYEFNIACRAFNSIGVDVTDLGPVPDLLRQILEETLSQEASQHNLENYLPKIRDIIINLLHGLKRKQSRLRARQNKDNVSTPPNGPSTQRAMSTTSVLSTGSADTSLTTMLEGVPSSLPSSMQSIAPNATRISGTTIAEEPEVPARTSSTQHTYSRSREDVNQLNGEESNRGSLRERRPQLPPSLSDSSMSSNTMQNIPVMTPEEYRLPIQRMSMIEDPPPPPPPPKQSDALLALQRGGDLERRASRRYSQYQISKHLGASPGGVPILPAQNTPIPNRGRDVRESLNAVRTRSSMLLSRQRSTRLRESPSRGTTLAPRISEEVEQPRLDTNALPLQQEDSPLAKTPEDKLGASYVDSSGNEKPAVSATLRGPLPDEFTRFNPPSSERLTPETDTDLEKSSSVHLRQDSAETNEEFILEQSPQPGKPFTLFLGYKSQVKKHVFPDGAYFNIGALQLAFIERYNWNTQNNGDLPEIYIQDPVSGVRYELDKVEDIKSRSVLLLNYEPLDDVKRYFKDGIGDLKKVVEGIQTSLDDQKLAMNLVSTRQDTAAKEIARLAASPPTSRPQTVQVNGIRPSIPTGGSLEDVQSLRRDLAVVRQTFASFSSSITSSMATIRSKAESVKSKAVDVTVPVLEGDSGRAYVDEGKKTLGDDFDAIMIRGEEVQDVVEDLRKDVVTRGVRPVPRQLEQVGKDLSMVVKDLKKTQDYLKKEKPIWTKVWEKELQTVCNDREFLSMQEGFIKDLELDLEQASETFSLIEQATKQQNSQAANGQPVALRSTSRGLPTIDPDVDPMKAKDSVLGEVRALRPNHENRLEAIERAEKQRRKELADRRGDGAAFKRELGNFVEEGKLRKSGGVEEAERIRKVKDEENLRGEWDAQQDRKTARARARAEERARQAQAQLAATEIEEGATENPTAEEEFADAAEVTTSSPVSTSVEDLTGAPHGSKAAPGAEQGEQLAEAS